MQTARHARYRAGLVRIVMMADTDKYIYFNLEESSTTRKGEVRQKQTKQARSIVGSGFSLSLRATAYGHSSRLLQCRLRRLPL